MVGAIVSERRHQRFRTFRQICGVFLYFERMRCHRRQATRIFAKSLFARLDRTFSEANHRKYQCVNAITLKNQLQTTSSNGRAFVVVLPSNFLLFIYQVFKRNSTYYEIFCLQQALFDFNARRWTWNQ